MNSKNDADGNSGPPHCYAVCTFREGVYRGRYRERRDDGAAMIELVEGPFDGFTCWVAAGRHVPEEWHSG